MISRYTLFETGGLRARFNFDMGLPKGVKPRYNIRPAMITPVILQRDNQTIVQPMIWGLLNQGAKDTTSIFRYKTFNVTAEKMLWTHSRETAVRTSRCLVPVNGYYVFAEERGVKRAFYIQRKDKALFALAGIYSNWTDPEGINHGTYSIITSRDDQDYSRFERRPNVIARDNEKRWIDSSISDTNSILEMLKPYPFDEFAVAEINPTIISTKQDSPSLITPLKRATS